MTTSNPAPVTGTTGTTGSSESISAAVLPAGIPVPQAPVACSEAERYERFAAALNRIRGRVRAELGDEDVAYIKGVRRVSTAFEVLGRALIHLSFEPVGFSTGVTALWLHKQLEATEIGHMALHGCYDKLDGAEAFHSKDFHWKIPIDEASWHRGHNQRHHSYTNIAGKDPDIHFGPVRLTEGVPHGPRNRFQLPYTLFALMPNFTFLMNMHFTGLVDVYMGNGRDEEFDFVEDRSWATVKDAHRRALRKYVPYYAKEYLLFPALAGPFFWKVALGNWLSEVMRDIYSAATILCGHVGEETASYPEGTRASGRGQWYAMQVEAANNFRVPEPISILCGALDLQIEHHLFPKFPPNRLREIQPEVEAVCAEHGVEYRMESWPKTLGKALSHIRELGKAGGGLLRRVDRVIGEMA